MSDIQIVLLNMLSWLHCFLVTNHIDYYAIGGTMLGAARHKGFIPWDDDVDIGIPRNDYNKLISLLSNNVGQYEIEVSGENNPSFCYPFAKLYDTNTTLAEHKKVNVKRGVYIDIFPLDGIGKDLQDSMSNYKPIKHQLDLLIARTAAVRKGRKPYKNLAVIAFKAIPNKLLVPYKIIDKINHLCSQRDFFDYEYGGNLVGSYRSKEILKKEYFGTPTLYKFQNINIYGVEKPDEYLTALYGDWRKLPEEEKRVSHHDFIDIDLNKSYKS